MNTASHFSGARSSNAGDAFHETWALREALKLLDFRASLTSLTLEGVRDNSDPEEHGSWHGVDCALYYDDATAPEKSRIELIQLKYSVASPRASWTLRRFCKSNNQRTNNSLARRLSSAFVAACKDKSDDLVRETISIKFVTNQPISESLISEVRNCAKGRIAENHYDVLQSSTGLTDDKLKLFCERLELKGGEAAHADLMVDIVNEIWNLTQSHSESIVDSLLMNIRQRMLPHGLRPIDRAIVLSWFRIGDHTGLFPCEPKLQPVELIVDREVTQELSRAIVDHSVVCFHGGGGCGKTTVAQSLEPTLPSGSRIILYDCYGAGTYRDRSQARHRPFEAFKQLANELARATNAPLFFPYDNASDMLRKFRAKLENAARLFQQSNPSSLLVILVDAADNAIHAAQSVNPIDQCFVSDLLSFEELPDNVRIVVSTRSSRIPDLTDPSYFVPLVKCQSFTSDETASYLEILGFSGSADLIADFHQLTGGNPRVQANALRTAKSLREAVDVLMPRGQSVDTLFENVLHAARVRSGNGHITAFCAAISVLPSPAPQSYVATLCEVDSKTLMELIDDLLPNLRISGPCVEFSNEDFEDYCRRRGNSLRELMSDRVASLLMRDRHSSEYAATHLFDVLVNAGRREELRICLGEINSTKVIRDPTKRRQVELSRLRTALYVSASMGDAVSIARTIIIGAESISTANKAKVLMSTNLDLSAAFVPDTIKTLVLHDSTHRNLQGPLLMHLSSEAARESDHLNARESLWGAYAWLDDLYQTSNREVEWSFSNNDLTAIAFGRFKLSGWSGVSSFCDRWRPRGVRFLIQFNLFHKMCIQDGPAAINDLLSVIDAEYLCGAVNVLTHAQFSLGTDVCHRCLTALESLDIDEVFCHEKMRMGLKDRVRILDEILFFLECSYSLGSLTAQIVLVLNRWRSAYDFRLGHDVLSRSSELDLFFRFTALRARCDNVEIDIISLLCSLHGVTQGPVDAGAQRGDSGKKRDLEEIRILVPLYKQISIAMYFPSEEATRSISSRFSVIHDGIRYGSHRYDSIRGIIVQRIVDVCAVHRLGIDLCLASLSDVSVKFPFCSSTHSRGYRRLLLDRGSVGAVVSLVESMADQIRASRLLSSDKADRLVELSRLLLEVDRADSREYFSEALEIVEDPDIETLDILDALCRVFSRCRRGTLDSDERAVRFARLIHRAGGLLEAESGFPREQALKALCAVSLPVAALTVSRWTDEGFGSVESELGTFVTCALQQRALTPAEATLLADVVSDDGLWLEDEILVAASESSCTMRKAIGVHFARRRLESVAPGSSRRDLAELEEVISCSTEGRPLPLQMLLEVESFREDNEVLLYPSREAHSARRQTKKCMVDGPPEWSRINPLDPEGIGVGLDRNRRAGYYDTRTYMASLRSRVGRHEQVSHIEALASLARSEEFPDYAIKSILAALSDWSGPAIQAWKRKNLANLIQDLGDSTLTDYWESHATLSRLLEFLDSNDMEIRGLIVQTIEQHAYNLGSRSLLQFAAELLLHLPSEEAESVVDWMLERVESRFRLGESSLDRYDLNVANLPVTGTKITEALLYRFLGDIDAHVRWRTAHALRRAHALGAAEILDGVLSRALCTDDQDFTFKDIPFHSLNADLFLTVSLARLSFEAPEVVAELAPKLLLVWTKRRPHLLVGQFVARALHRTRDSGWDLGVDEAELRRMACEDPKYAVAKEGDWRFRTGEQNGGRFYFNSIDTLPYWYSRAEKLFADLPQGLFLKTAESWIVDKWGGDEHTAEWICEPRRHRLERCNHNLYLNRHGSLPQIDRYSTYLEWHAMFATVGELIQAHPLRDVGAKDPGNEFRQWVSDRDTTYSGTWLADIRQPPPSDLRYWRLPEPTTDNWLSDITSIAGISESVTEDGRFILASCREATISLIETKPGQETIRTRAAFVPPKTACALLRVFHATADASHVWVDEDWAWTDQDDIDAEFRITPAVRYPTASDSLGLDQHDARRLNVRGLNFVPSHELLAAAELAEGEPWETQWKSKGGERVTICYETWSSRPNDAYVQSPIWPRPTVEGYRLSIEKDALRAAMDTLEKDLIVTVNRRRSKRERQSNFTQGGTNDGEHAEVLLYRRDGRIENAKGRVGTWY